VTKNITAADFIALANREIKDGVFKIFFENPENAAELYSAIEGTPCSPEEIEIITIMAIISGKLKNDLAFVVRNRIMVVGEHMSSPCTNMPVRFLMYVGQLIEKWIKMKGASCTKSQPLSSWSFITEWLPSRRKRSCVYP